MAKWKELKQQVLAGTKVDSQGEKNTKEFLLHLRDKFNSRDSFPLSQKHDISLEHVGYIKNFQVVQADKEGHEWNLVGDIYFHDVEIDEALKGFSYSIIDDLLGDIKNKEIGIYVPFPYYKDEELLGDLTSSGDGIVAGAWRKKGADLDTISLIISLVSFFGAPAYTDFWNNKISPLLKNLKSKLPGSHSVNYVQLSQGIKGETFGIYFIPIKGKEDECLTLDLILKGIQITNDYVTIDVLAREKGVYLIKLIFSENINGYELKTIEYLDGSVINV